VVAIAIVLMFVSTPWLMLSSQVNTELAAGTMQPVEKRDDVIGAVVIAVCFLFYYWNCKKTAYS
jgi:hypothetical protein